jgi:hypothetical protein
MRYPSYTPKASSLRTIRLGSMGWQYERVWKGLAPQPGMHRPESEPVRWRFA